MLKRENESTENILNQELVIPEETQRKIEAAYDIVRARSRAAQDGREKTVKTEKESGKKKVTIITYIYTYIYICRIP